MQTRPLVAAILGFALAATPPVRADDVAAATPSPGTRVRFETATDRWETATIVETDGDALVVRLSRTSALVRMPLAGMGRLQVSAGLRSNANTGAILGAIPGVLFGGFAGAYAACYESQCDLGGVPAAAIGAFFVGLLTGLVGAGIGALIKTEHWKPLSAPRAAIQVGPTGQGGLAIGLKLSF